MKRIAVCLFGVLLACTSLSTAAEKQAAELLPATTILYTEVPQPKQILHVVFDHPLRARLEAIEEYQRALESPQMLKAKAGVAIFEATMGKPWRSVIEEVSEGGVYIGADAQTDAAILLVQARDEASLGKLIETVIDLARQDALRQGKEDPVRTAEYREVTAHQIDKAAFVRLGRWLAVTNKSEAGKALIDRYLDGGPSLADNESFQQARKETVGEPDVWSWLDMQAVRKSGKADKLMTGRSENPAAELLFGGLVDNLKQTPYVTSSTYLEQNEARLVVAAPHKTEWIAEEREYFFGPGGKGAAPPLLEAKQTLLSISAYRNISEMWLRADDLVEEGAADELAKADSNLSTLFGGRDFGEDILGSIKPGLQLLVARQEFAAGKPQPEIKLPAAALVGRMRDPEAMRVELRRTFVNLIGFLNIIGAMNGQPQLDIDFDKQDDNLLIHTRYAETDKQGLINFNFSPSVAFTGDVVIVATTESLARELWEQAAEAKEQPDEMVRTNAAISFHAAALRELLADNREHLVAKNMLEEGHTKEEAERQIDALLAIVGVFRDARLKLDVSDNKIEFEARLRLKEE
jgi:hypothetical protein